MIDYLNKNADVTYDLYMHLGDFAYEIQDSIGKNGDKFFDLVSPAASAVPYIVVGGNHENIDSLQMFNYRFRMPGGRDDILTRNVWYSYDIRDTHWIGLNLDYFIWDETQQGRIDMLNWLDDDLKKARELDAYKFII